jgi:hypothetical protein
MEAEQIASIHIFKGKDGFGARVVTFSNGMDSEPVPCSFSTLGSLLSVVAGLVLSVLKSREA